MGATIGVGKFDPSKGIVRKGDAYVTVDAGVGYDEPPAQPAVEDEPEPAPKARRTKKG